MRHYFTVRGAVLAIGILAYNSLQTSAQVTTDPNCKQDDQVTASIDRISKVLDKVASSVEAVPPAAAQSLKDEVQKALEHKTNSDLVASNHFYFPLKFHDNFNIAAGNLQAAKDARLGKDRARYLVVVLLRLADVNSDMEGYIDFDLKRRPAILNDDARSTMRSRLQGARIQTTSLLQCIIDQL